VMVYANKHNSVFKDMCGFLEHSDLFFLHRPPHMSFLNEFLYAVGMHVHVRCQRITFSVLFCYFLDFPTWAGAYENGSQNALPHFRYSKCNFKAM
jgi:hypothetical protein